MSALKLLIVSALAFALPAAAQPSAEEAARSADRIKAHVTFLASDLLQGREAGSAGYDIAANYVASQFAQLVAMAAPRFRGDRDKADHAVRAWVAAVDDDLVRDGASTEAIKQPRKFWQDLAADQFGRAAAAARICSRRHDPPCADEAICTRRYLADLRKPAEAQA